MVSCNYLKLNIENMASPASPTKMGCLRRNNQRRANEENQTLALCFVSALAGPPQVRVHESQQHRKLLRTQWEPPGSCRGSGRSLGLVVGQIHAKQSDWELLLGPRFPQGGKAVPDGGKGDIPLLYSPELPEIFTTCPETMPRSSCESSTTDVSAERGRL